MTSGSQQRWGQVVAAILLAMTAAVFLLVASGRITARFGDSDEGINGAVWSYNAASLRQDGLLASKLGGHREDGTLYASHPPAIDLETAAAQALAGGTPAASRAPAWLGSLAALGLLFWLLVDAGYEPLVAAGSVGLVGLTPMLVVYGAMLDTPITALPFGLAVLFAWRRDWESARPVRWWVAGLLALLACLSAWQAAVLTLLCGLSLAAPALRHRVGAIRRALPYLGGAAIGLALSFGWVWWVYGSFHVLFQKYSVRTGADSGTGIGSMISFQVPWLSVLLGLSVIGLVACAVALRDRRRRPLAAMALASVVVYALAFHAAAAGHQYWNYWALIPAAVGWAYALDSLVRRARASSPSPALAVGVVVVVVAVGAAFSLARPDKAAAEIDRGHQAADLVAGGSFPADQRTLPYVGQPYRADAWVTYETRFSPQPLTSTTQVDQLAATRPHDLVLVLGSCLDGLPSTEFCHQATAAAEAPGATEPAAPQLISAAELSARLHHPR